MHALEARGPSCFEVPPLRDGGRPRDRVQLSLHVLVRQALQ